MMRFLTLLAVATVASAANPTFPTQYYVNGKVSMPYADLEETFETWFDGKNSQQRISYDSDLDVYVYQGGLGASYQINPVYMDGKNSNKCFATIGSPSDVPITNFLPDLSKFKHMPNRTTVNNVMCDVFEYVFTVGKKVNTYTMAINAETTAPVQYSYVGYDELLGSHYDKYIIDYHVYIAGFSTFNITTFAKPDMSCGDFPGPGYTNPGRLPQSMFPFGDSGHADYAKDHGRYYEPEEAKERDLHFRTNLRYIHMTNRATAKAGRSMRLAVNFLADASEAELAKRASVNDRKHTPNNAMATHVASGAPLPASVNWTAHGATTPVKDQAICGSCWSFATAESVESANFIKTGKLVALSQQSLMDCSWDYGNLACDGGESFRAFDYILQKRAGKFPTHDSYGPYLMVDGRCHIDDSDVKTGATVIGYKNVTVGSENDLMDALAMQPVSIAIDAALKSFSFYSTGVYYDAACKSDADSLDHAVLAAGYGTENGEDYWLVRNSWSTYWGDQGYVKMSRKDNNCGVATDAVFPVVTA